jgi:hypothetical protein
MPRSLRRRAGIAQLVEQAIENRRVPSSNLGPGIADDRLRTMRQPPITSSQVFNNADSFAQAFDEAWKAQSRRDPERLLSAGEKLELILTQVADHPFSQSDPAMARQVAEFRIRLLDL